MNTPRRKPPVGPSPDSSLSVAKLAGSYIRKGGKLPIAVAVVTVFLFAAFMYGEDIKSLAEYSWWQYKTTLFDADYSPLSEAANVSVPETCDLAQGDWVFDDVDYPLYREDRCEFMSRQVSCLQNGRPDAMYQKWRWQPKDCSLPKFNARLMLERLRGKRMMFIGDSINRNQWESMVCLLQTVVPPGKRSRIVDGSRIIFPVKEYRASIEFYWAPFLVESNSDEPEFHSIPVRIINADAIEKHAVYWKKADVLVFNTYIWWMNDPKMKVLRPGATNWTEHDEIARGEAYQRVLKTVFNWVDRTFDPNKTSVFFVSMSPLHNTPANWGNPNGIKCAKETVPLSNMTGVHISTEMNLWALAKKATASTARVPITFIDITAMSEYRKDAHTSVYTMQHSKLLTPEQKADPANYADCIHWCVPGLPDTWNQILFARLLSGWPRRQ
ncbi:hypothetical protein Cni_G13541 [Canna indica]|uniref:Trichome birefringence-like N-terminal domain-containing protein n=1 Tax=Canna indica TaxID=4628 RepID=A0AAQ3KBE5_9LILI|nr:hypothetical protein Cni_G13541 [Canna indica]